MVKNALAYCANGDPSYSRMLANSVNSFFASNGGGLLDEVVLLTDKRGLRVPDGIDPRAKIRVVSGLTHDYSTMAFPDEDTKRLFSTATFFRWELFNNPLFLEYDNVLYLDNDTEVWEPVEELFPRIPTSKLRMVQQEANKMDVYGIDLPRYCNTGVMSLSPKTIGADVLRRLFVELVETNKRTQFRYVDQDTLNFVLSQDGFNNLVETLPGEYNFFRSTAKMVSSPDAKVKIRHYVKQKDYPTRFLPYN